MDQRQLVERAAQGDHDAFAQLAGAAIARLDAAARLILRDPELARDAVQETLVRAWQDLPRLRDPGRFDAWLHRIVTNACLGVWRRRRRRPIEVELVESGGPVADDISSAFAERDVIDRALHDLPADWRAVVVLHFYLGMPLSEVAEALAIPVGTAKSRLHRSLVAMQATIGDADEPARGPVPGGQVV